MYRGAKPDGLFNGDALFRIAVAVHQLAEIKLADDFLGLGGTGFVARGAGEVRLSTFVEKPQGGDFLFRENGQGVIRAFENFGYSH